MHQGVVALSEKLLRFAAFLVLLCLAALLLRSALIEMGFIDSSRLEALAENVQGRAVAVEEAVTIFFHDLIQDGPY